MGMRRINETKKRSIIKSITAKIFEIAVGSIILSVIGLPVVNSIGLTVLIETSCFLTNFVNERLWNLTDWERKIKDDDEDSKTNDNWDSWVDEEFTVKCHNCGNITVKPKGKHWTFCPNCKTALDIMNRCDEVGKKP